MLFFLFIGRAQSTGEAAQKQLIERGRYLVDMGGCNDCHSPKTFTQMGPVPDTTRLLSGHPQHLALPEIPPGVVGPDKWVLFNMHSTASVGPWGASFAANLTPDKSTGIGLWKVKHFIGAMRNGKHMGSGRNILPPMPWFNLTGASDGDLTAIFAYLQSLPPIKNRVPAPIPPNELFK